MTTATATASEERPRKTTLSILERLPRTVAPPPSEQDLLQDLENYRSKLAQALVKWSSVVTSLERRPMRIVAALILDTYMQYRLGELTRKGEQPQEVQQQLNQELPFLLEVIRHLAPLEEMIGVQPLDSHMGLIFHGEGGELTQVAVKAVMRLLRGTWRPSTLAQLHASGEPTARSVAFQIIREHLGRIATISDVHTISYLNELSPSIMELIPSLWDTCPHGLIWLVVSEELARRVDSLVPNFRRCGSIQDRYGYGLTPLGHLVTIQEDTHGLPMDDQVWGKIFVDPTMESQTALIGVKGDSMMGSGYIYAPFLLAQPSDGEHMNSIRNRAAYRMVNPDYFRVLHIQEPLSH